MTTITKRPMFILGVLLYLLSYFIINTKIISLNHIAGDGDSIALKGKLIEIQNSTKSDVYIVKISSNKKIRIYDNLGSNSFKIGNTLSVKGTYHIYKSPSNKGEFDTYSYYISQREVGYIYPDKIKVINNKYNKLLNNINVIRNKWIANIQLITGKKHQGIIMSIVLGDKSLLDKKIKKEYLDSGISHILAISGLHLSLIGNAIYLAFKKIFSNRLITGIVSICIMFFYVYMCGMSISQQRAFIMFCLFVISEILGRQTDICNSLGIASIILILKNPYCVLSQSFTFSFSCVLLLGIIQNIDRISNFYKMLLFQFGMIPIILFYNNSYPTYSVFINMIILPLFSIVLFSAILSIGFFEISIILSKLVMRLSTFILDFYEKLCRLFSKMPFSHINSIELNSTKIIYYYIVFAVILVYLHYIGDKFEDNKIFKKKSWIDYSASVYFKFKHQYFNRF